MSIKLSYLSPAFLSLLLVHPVYADVPPTDLSNTQSQAVPIVEPEKNNPPNVGIPVRLQYAKLGAEFTRDLNYFELEKPKEYSLYFEDFPTQNNLKVDVKSDVSLRILESDGYRTLQSIQPAEIEAAAAMESQAREKIKSELAQNVNQADTH